MHDGVASKRASGKAAHQAAVFPALDAIGPPGQAEAAVDRQIPDAVQLGAGADRNRTVAAKNPDLERRLRPCERHFPLERFVAR